jgi:DNA-binding XRE family transcriptional regulator
MMRTFEKYRIADNIKILQNRNIVKLSLYKKEDAMSFKKAREAAGMTYAQACEALHVSQTALYYWESGKYTPETKRLKGIAALYGCTVDDLLREDDAE